MMRVAANNPIMPNAQRRVGGRGNSGNDLMQRLMQQRLQEQKREMRLREKEDEHIKLITERMNEVKNSDMEWDLIRAALSSLTHQKNRIYENRAERERIAAENEMIRTKIVLEEMTRVREVQHKNVNLHQDEEEAQQRDAAKGLIRVAVARDRVTTLKQNRAALAEREVHARHAVDSPNSSNVFIGRGPGVETVISSHSGRGNPNDFRNQELHKLTEGIARTDAAISLAVSSMYRESARAQESWLAEYQNQFKDECEDGSATRQTLG